MRPVYRQRTVANIPGEERDSPFRGHCAGGSGFGWSRGWVRAAAWLLVGLAAAGCRPQPLRFPESLNSPYPDERVQATRRAVDYPYATPAERRVALELLVARLEDEDDAARFFAILALEKMTGTRLGYAYHASADERLRAVQSWRRYLEREAQLADEPAWGSASRPALAPGPPEATLGAAQPGGATGNGRSMH